MIRVASSSLTIILYPTITKPLNDTRNPIWSASTSEILIGRPHRTSSRWTLNERGSGTRPIRLQGIGSLFSIMKSGNCAQTLTAHPRQSQPRQYANRGDQSTFLQRVAACEATFSEHSLCKLHTAGLTLPASILLTPSSPLQRTTAQPSACFSFPVLIQPMQLARTRKYI